MGNNLTKLFIKEERPLTELKGSSLALDITSLIYQSIYALSHQGVPLKDSTGRITSHVKRILPLLCRLRRLEIDPLICFDDRSPGVKKEQVFRREHARKKTLDNLELIDKTVGLTPRQYKTKSLLRLTPQEKRSLITTLKSVLQAAGVPYNIMEYQEAEKLCASLKLRGVVKNIYSSDRDVLLYGVPVITKIDFKLGLYTLISYRSNLIRMGLKDQEQFLMATIMAGTDYSPGLKGVGPHTALKIIKTQGVDRAKSRMDLQGIPHQEIKEYLVQDPGIMGLVFREPDPALFQSLLRGLEFNQSQILSYLLDLMGGPDVLDRVRMIPPGFEPGSSGPHPDRLPKLPQGTTVF